jgi:hypothetical protein
VSFQDLDFYQRFHQGKEAIKPLSDWYNRYTQADSRAYSYFTCLKQNKMKLQKRKLKPLKFEAIIKIVNEMGYKRTNLGTPGQTPNQQTIIAIWKRPNQLSSPQKALTMGPQDDEEGGITSPPRMIPIMAQSLLEDSKPAASLKSSLDGSGSSNSSATEKIENLQLHSTASSPNSTTGGSHSTLDAWSLTDFPPLVSTPATASLDPGLHKPIPSSTNIENNRAPFKKQTGLGNKDLLNNKGASSAEVSSTLEGKTLFPPVADSNHSQPTKEKETKGQVQYNPYFYRNTSATVKPLGETIPKGLDKQIVLKKGAVRHHIHHYDLRLKVKQSKTEDDEVAYLQQAIQKFLDISLQADPLTTIPPPSLSLTATARRCQTSPLSIKSLNWTPWL